MPDARSSLPDLVAHRGNAADYPENSLPAFASALDAGIPWIELDVQLSADGVPFVIHDATLERTTRAQGDLRRLPAERLRDVDAGEPRRFGGSRSTPLPELNAFAGLLARHPQAGAFIELKLASLELHGREYCVDRVLEALGPVAGRCVPLSFDEAAVGIARARTGGPVGWVIERFDTLQLELLAELSPEFVFYDRLKCREPGLRLPPGPWRWAAYEVRNAAQARTELARGASLLESMSPLALRAALATGDEPASGDP